MEKTEKFDLSVSPEAIVEFLKKNGWKKITRKRADVAVYQKETPETDWFFQVDLPLDKTLSDYDNAMKYAIMTIAQAENLPVDFLLQELHKARKEECI